MYRRIFYSFIPLIFIFACSTEDPDTGPIDKEPEPEPVEEKDNEPPTVPDELSISEKSFESLTLSWRASSDNDKVAKYYVFIDASKVDEVTSTTATLSGLSPGNSYALSVAAVDASGNISPRSNELKTETAIDTESPSVPDDLSVTNITETSVTITWQPSSDNAGVYEYAVFINGELYGTAVNTELTLQDLEPGKDYSIKILSKDIYGNNSPLSEALNFTTNTPEENPPGGGNVLLMLSEYVEGSSDNKALEMVNISSEEIDLTGYSLKKISNQNQNWSDEKKLEGILSSGDVFVVAHSKADPMILQYADIQMGGGIIDFNGNDPIGLFKDGVLIDIIGFTGGEDFAKDVTLRRKTSVNSPASTFDPEEWEILDKDNFEGLGKF